MMIAQAVLDKKTMQVAGGAAHFLGINDSPPCC